MVQPPENRTEVPAAIRFVPCIPDSTERCRWGCVFDVVRSWTDNHIRLVLYECISQRDRNIAVCSALDHLRQRVQQRFLAGLDALPIVKDPSAWLELIALEHTKRIIPDPPTNVQSFWDAAWGSRGGRAACCNQQHCYAKQSVHGWQPMWQTYPVGGVFRLCPRAPLCPSSLHRRERR